MLGIIFTAHGNFSSGINSSLKLITGGRENVSVLDFTEENTATYEDELKALIEEKLTKYEGLIIATDLMGGTPFNKSVLLTTQYDNVRVLSGVNFPMAYEIAFSDDDLDKTVQSALNSSKEGIVVYEQKIKTDSSEDSMEDGI